MSDLYFGFDTERLLVRLRRPRRTVREQLAESTRMRVTFLAAGRVRIVGSQPGRQEAGRRSCTTTTCRWPRRACEAAADMLFELGDSLSQPGAVETDEPRAFLRRAVARGAADRADPARRGDRNRRSLAGLRIDHVAGVRLRQ